MEEWKEYKLSDILTIVSGFAYKGEYLGKGESLLLGMGCVSYSELFLEKGMRPYAGEFPERYSVEAGDIVLATRQQSDNLPILGMPAIIPQKFMGKKMVFGANLYKVVPKSPEFPIDYIYWLLKTPAYIHHIRSCQTGTTVRMITKANIEDYAFMCPCKEQRNQISKLLWDIEMKIELNRRINDNLEQQAQALFKSWFVDFEPFKDGEFVDSELGMIPKGWRVGTIAELTSNMISGDWGKESLTTNYSHKVFCIRGADIPDLKVGNRGKMPIRFILEKNFMNKRLNPDDLVIEVSGGSPTQSTGRVCRISSELISYYNKAIICTNFCKSISPIKEYSAYIYYLWDSLYKQGIMFLYENGTTGIKNLDINGMLEKLKVIIPPEEIAFKFSNAISKLSNKTLANSIESAKLAQIRDSLLPRLMSGELKINDLNC